jgi:SAM-dependent methyltransferase
MKGFEDASWKVNGIEPNNTMAAYGRENLNLDIQTGSFENFTTTNKFDLITMIQVIGHFYDIDKALLQIKSLLKKDGLVLVESWNKDSLVAKMMGKNWHEYSPPSVVNWFSDETLADLFSSYGFRLVAKGHPPKKISIKHAISLLQEKSPDFFLIRKFYAGLERLFGKLNINYPPLDVKWYLFKHEGQ